MVNLPATADTVMDPACGRLAETYARAILGLCQQTGQGEAACGELAEVVSLLGTVEGSGKLLTSLMMSQTKRVAMVRKIFGGRVSPHVEGLLVVMAGNGRLDILPAVVAGMRRLLDGLDGKVEAELVTPHEMDEAAIASLADSLGKAIGARLTIRNRVDVNLIGGAVLRIGDRVYDASVAGRLERLTEALVRQAGRIPPPPADQSE